ncbi:MAG: hypothetical protein AB1515_03730 [Nitrospirota bacterium]
MPGMILIVSISIVTFSPDDVWKFIQNASFLPIVLLVGFAWIVAFAVQAIGETTGLICYHTYKTNADFYVRRHQFLQRTSVPEHQQLERLVVIKEACGNGYLALGLSALLLSLNALVTDDVCAVPDIIKLHWPVILFVVGLIIFLAKMHFIHVRRQDKYMNAILNASNSDGK